ncbi:MAG: polymer-forming cytoskeletal protein, partial [Chloroflexota bacterium]
MTRMLRPGVALVAALMLLLIVATLALAEQSLLGGKLRTGDTVTVASSETVNGDLYAFAGSVRMEGTVDGDLVALGGQITVSGKVTGDLIAAGGTISVTGTVDGDARTAGGQVTVSGPVGEDLVIAGGQTTLASGGTVGGDLIISGGNVSVAGSVTGNVEASAGTYARSGTVGGTEHVVQSSQGGVQEPEPGSKVLDAIRHFIVLLLLGALILWLMPRVLRTSAETLRRQPLLALGAGVLTFLAYIVFVIAALLLMILLAILFGLLKMGALVAIELIASLLAITVVSFLFVLAIAFVADLVVGLTLGRLVASDPPASRWQELLILAAGAAVVVIVTSLPIIGGLAKL